ncbi:phosphoribosylanthranilate isomerase [Oceanihabitans sediminis]|nr:phosphoribosylanthranilate isomerase [Oceanihabitans sediminis]
MKSENNILDVAEIQPDYLGFIFYKNSPRFLSTDIPEVPESIKKVGVFVNASLAFIVDKIEYYNLQVVQLHGEESPELCEQLKEYNVQVIKVFSVKNQFDFSVLEPYEDVCDYYLFDTKGREPGGTGHPFNWNVFKKYPSSKPYFLSGGIGPKQLQALLLFLKRPESDLCCALDLNSKFEKTTGIKDISLLKEFKHQLAINNYIH